MLLEKYKDASVWVLVRYIGPPVDILSLGPKYPLKSWQHYQGSNDIYCKCSKYSMRSPLLTQKAKRPISDKTTMTWPKEVNQKLQPFLKWQTKSDLR